MSSDLKRRGKRAKKRTFHGNRWSKKSKLDSEATDFTEIVLNDSCDEDIIFERESNFILDQEQPDHPPNDTPTQSEIKLKNLYVSVKNSSQLKCKDSDTDSESDSDEEDAEREGFPYLAGGH